MRHEKMCREYHMGRTSRIRRVRDGEPHVRPAEHGGRSNSVALLLGSIRVRLPQARLQDGGRYSAESGLLHFFLRSHLTAVSTPVFNEVKRTIDLLL